MMSKVDERGIFDFEAFPRMVDFHSASHDSRTSFTLLVPHHNLTRDEQHPVSSPCLVAGELFLLDWLESLLFSPSPDAYNLDAPSKN